uniref:Uncharacterized protein n=1 Tax=uncultured marine virus TaxID=186617 RepID=A0A0F7L2N3_9VIRU|nr:hypothetical protein [uncultured marine virus]
MRPSEGIKNRRIASQATGSRTEAFPLKDLPLLSFTFPSTISCDERTTLE